MKEGTIMANNWGWPFKKAYTGSYEEGQQFGYTSYLRPGGSYFHDGFDFGSAIYGQGSDILAVTDGQIIYTGIEGGGLNAVIILSAPPYQIMYQEFSQSTADIFVSSGSRVTKGQRIGRLNSSHLHLGITQKDWRTALGSWTVDDGTWLNPIPILQTGGNQGSGGYELGSIVNGGYSISQANIQSVIHYGTKNNIKPSFMIAQMFLESHWGDPNTSYVGSVDNNWSGISEPFSYPSDLGIQTSRGTARPANEGGYYVHFATLDDFFNAYGFLLSKRNGLYNVEGATSVDAYVKGLFRVGGAKYDYAAVGYQSYLNQFVATYNAIKNQNPGKLEAIDSATPGGNNTNSIKGETTMEALYKKGNAMYYFSGDKIKILTDPAQITILETIYWDNNGKKMPKYDWSKPNPTADLLEVLLKNNLVG